MKYKFLSLVVFLIILAFLLTIRTTDILPAFNKYNKTLSTDIRANRLNEAIPTFIIEYVSSSYLIVEPLGEVERYIFDEGVLKGDLGDDKERYWQLQDIDYEDLFEEVIVVYAILISGHQEDLKSEEYEHTVLWVITCNNNIVGGYAYPDHEGLLLGGYSNYYGSDIEEIYGISYSEFISLWNQNYSSVE